MEEFLFKNMNGISVLSASMTDHVYKKHRHGDYCIGVTLKGVQECDLDGHKVVSKESGVLLFNPEQAHTGNARDCDPMDYVMIYLPQEVMKEAFELRDTLTFRESLIYDASVAMPIYQAVTSAVEGDQEAFTGNLTLALDLLSQKKLLKNVQTDPRGDFQLDAIRHVQGLMKKDLNAALSLEVLGDQVSMSKYQLIRLFKRYVGLTPYQYQLNLKVEKAKEIMDTTGDAYEAVAAMNFTDLSHLNRCLKSIYGVTSGQYTKSLH